MMHRLAASVILLIALALVPETARAQPDQPVTVDAVSHGIHITLLIPRQTYPKDALVRFTVTLENVSQHNRYIQDWPPDWGGRFSPHILMRTSADKLVYEEQLSTFLAPTPGSSADNYVLQPGHSITRHVRFVLQAEQAQAVARIADGYTSFRARPGTPMPTRSQFARHLWRIATPFIALTLTHEPAPTITVLRSGMRMHATVHPAWPVSGDPLYMESTRCWTGKSMMWVEQELPWTVAPNAQFSTSIYRTCPSPQPWRAVAGWPNHRVAFLDYPDIAANT